ncbi:hypothetical protein GOP47_0010866 [Adiantum capillus-veneris]|uniref:Uncharacterized protein n=1 Tax=Adiantum capillus-veneris TaxID=13818 RepID=A0A9D4ZJ77_ADICA|nr:hypothetical protein GOP47_0010866 [Adiantum capillus-veneris]
MKIPLRVMILFNSTYEGFFFPLHSLVEIYFLIISQFELGEKQGKLVVFHMGEGLKLVVNAPTGVALARLLQGFSPSDSIVSSTLSIYQLPFIVVLFESSPILMAPLIFKPAT